ncbi:MAG: LysR family transcriptional regulator [Bacteroidota bacterium]
MKNDDQMTPFSVKYKVWIENHEGEGILGDGKWKLLKAIQETGSLKLAIEKLNLSYRKTWNNLQKLELLLGFEVIETTRGGVEKGSATLTPKGIAIVQAFEEFHNRFDDSLQKACNSFSKDLNKVIETARIRKTEE